MSTPCQIGKNQLLVMIGVDYNQKLKAIFYNREDSIVTCLDGALSTNCKDAGGIVPLDAEEVKIIDDLLSKYLETLLWNQETTKSSQGE